MDNTRRFDGKGKIYAEARPSYSEELMDYIKDSLNVPSGGVFADIGSGTGIFSEQLLKCGYRVFAVEPNDDMRKIAEQKLIENPHFTSIKGTADNTTLLSDSIDCVTAAQAFHWFDAESFKKECRRILKPEGKIIIVYNSRDEQAECNLALAEIYKKFCSDFRGFSNGINSEKCRDFFGGKCEIFCVENAQFYSRQGYIKRVLSSSYSLQENDVSFAEYIEDVGRVFDTFAEGGVLKVPIHTKAYIGFCKDI